VEHYNNAEKMGEAVARSILGDESPYGYIHSFWSDQYEHSLEYVGHADTWDAFVLRGSLRERTFLGFYLRGGVLRAVVGLNRGGDPELDEQSELHACQVLISRQAALPVAALRDERFDLRGRLTTK
jgi:3-phenylpropionate/trans-cinnamate dioxygenase ferredoxin reductase subunit